MAVPLTASPATVTYAIVRRLRLICNPARTRGTLQLQQGSSAGVAAVRDLLVAPGA